MFEVFKISDDVTDSIKEVKVFLNKRGYVYYEMENPENKGEELFFVTGNAHPEVHKFLRARAILYSN